MAPQAAFRPAPPPSHPHVLGSLILDKELGTLLKVDRFGLVKRAMHGTRMLGWQDIRDAYGREVRSCRSPCCHGLSAAGVLREPK